jgi:hypothetical protein
VSNPVYQYFIKGEKMNEKNTKYLLEKYPKLYSQHKLSPQETCMCWLFCCGDGWIQIIDNLSEKIIEIDPEIEAVQVKEKFGGLRFYINGAKKETADEIYTLIHKAESESLKTCEKCGNKENAKLRDDSWIFTLCDKCFEDKQNNPGWRIE